jgi:hypothetical protein
VTALALLLAGLWAILAFAPDTPVAGLVHRWLVEAPARRLATVRRGSVVAVLLGVGLLAAAAAIDLELLHVATMAAPEAATWLSMVEIGTLIDAGIAVFTARAAIRWTDLRRSVALNRPRARARRAPRPPRPPANDDEDGPARRAA